MTASLEIVTQAFRSLLGTKRWDDARITLKPMVTKVTHNERVFWIDWPFQPSGTYCCSEISCYMPGGDRLWNELRQRSRKANFGMDAPLALIITVTAQTGAKFRYMENLTTTIEQDRQWLELESENYALIAERWDTLWPPAEPEGGTSVHAGEFIALILQGANGTVLEAKLKEIEASNADCEAPCPNHRKMIATMRDIAHAEWGDP